MNTVHRCGDRALLADVLDVHGTVRALRSLPPPGMVDVVPGAGTVLLVHSAEADVAALRRRLEAVEPLPEPWGETETVTLEVVYDGPDLDDVAALVGMSRAEVVARHASADYDVAFCGFSPGFGYLRGLDPALVVPRLASPRTEVPAGAVAIADVWSAVYPRSSPGGWRLLGRTDATLWDLGRPQPALLAPGTRVRFVEVGR